MKLIRVGFLAVFILTVMSLPASGDAQEDTIFELTILHTNDAHANHEPDRDGIGGVARQSTFVEEVRADSPNTLLLDAGDRFTGSVYHSYHQGYDSAQVMDFLEYDAMVLGSYEFTHGAQVLADFINELTFPVVVNNVDFSQSEALNGLIEPYIIIEVGGEQIGITGVTRGDSRLRPIPELDFNTDYLTTTQSAIDEMTDQGVNKIILISHLGYFDDLELAAGLSHIDVIIGGDSETLLSNTIDDAEGPYPAVTTNLDGNDVLVVQAGDRNEFVGQLNVFFDGEGNIVDWSGNTYQLTDQYDIDPDAEALVAELLEPIDVFLSEEIGETLIDIDGTEETCRFEECNMGNLITDALVATTDAQIALQNGGGIRSSISEGSITAGNVLQVLPFNNTYVTVELTGEDIIAALENGVSRVDATDGTGRFLQVSGLRYTYNASQPVGQRIVEVEVLNDGEFEEIDPDEIYVVATNDFIGVGGDDYTMFVENGENLVDFGRTLEEAVRFYIADVSPINPTVEGRIIRLDR